MTNIHRLIIFLAFVMLGCAPNVIKENKKANDIENKSDNEIQIFK